MFQSAVAHELISSGHGVEGGVKWHYMFQSAVAHELISSASLNIEVLSAARAFQSAVAHELISSRARSCSRWITSPSFKALSRMSSFPARLPRRKRWWQPGRFKALSRMSSFPARRRKPSHGQLHRFQSAVAHELISSESGSQTVFAARRCCGFKALSRMSSFPAVRCSGRIFYRRSFQSAVAHELISSILAGREIGVALKRFKALSRMSSFPAMAVVNAAAAGEVFQSAVAHELISSSRGIAPSHVSTIVSKRCRA